MSHGSIGEFSSSRESCSVESEVGREGAGCIKSIDRIQQLGLEKKDRMPEKRGQADGIMAGTANLKKLERYILTCLPSSSLNLPSRRYRKPAQPGQSTTASLLVCERRLITDMLYALLPTAAQDRRQGWWTLYPDGRRRVWCGQDDS